MSIDFEVGYTPTNLRLAIEKLGITQAALAHFRRYAAGS